MVKMEPIQIGLFVLNALDVKFIIIRRVMSICVHVVIKHFWNIKLLRMDIVIAL